MKPAIAITLILTGAVLILTPPASEQLRHRNTLEAMTVGRATNNLYSPGAMLSNYALGCWSVGAFSILAAIYFSVRSKASDGHSSAI